MKYRITLDRDTVNELSASEAGDTFRDFTWISSEIFGTTRWGTLYWVVIQDSEGRYLGGTVEEAATEMQGDYDEPVEFIQVLPREKTIIVYE